MSSLYLALGSECERTDLSVLRVGLIIGTGPRFEMVKPVDRGGLHLPLQCLVDGGDEDVIHLTHLLQEPVHGVQIMGVAEPGRMQVEVDGGTVAAIIAQKVLPQKLVGFFGIRWGVVAVVHVGTRLLLSDGWNGDKDKLKYIVDALLSYSYLQTT